MSNNKIILVGDIVQPVTLNDLICTSGYVKVENGKITEIGANETFNQSKSQGHYDDIPIHYLSKDQFLMPGFVDCHTHAPQFPNIGLGLDRPLLEWLDKYTFPLETEYSNKEFAANVYDKVVRTLINNGTTTACYFGTLHFEGTLELVKSVLKYQQRALVGKVSMNTVNDAGYYNSTEDELRDTEEFVKKVYSYQNMLIEPVITPRFALSCDKKLMIKLAEMARKYQCAIQTHISENRKEVEYVLKTNPECKNYSQVYDECGILSNRCIVAHAIHLGDDEIAAFARKGVAVAHCPASNTRLKSGMCPVRKFLENYVKIGLGTDVSGGDSASVLDAIRRTMDVSEHLNMSGAKESALNWKEALYLATVGGAKALGLQDKIGYFKVNDCFDALIIDVSARGGPIVNYAYSAKGTDAIAEKVQKFIYCGDDRNIVRVYINGVKVKDIL